MSDQNHMPISDQPFVVVTGAMRSGTTLAGNLLTSLDPSRPAHADLTFCNDKSSIVRDLSTYFRLEHLDDADLLDADLTVDLDSVAIDWDVLQQYSGTAPRVSEEVDIENLKSLVMSEIQKGAFDNRAAPTVGCKTTNLLWEFNMLRQLFHPARMIVLIRDPRDCLASHIARTARELPYLEACYHMFAILAYLQLAEEHAPDVLFVHYEKLVADPEREVRRILDFLELSADGYDWSSLREGKVASNSSYNKLSGKGLVPNFGISEGSVGVYKNRLSTETITLTEVLLAPYMKHHGYDGFGREESLDRETAKQLLVLFATYYRKYRFSAKPLMLRLAKDFNPTHLEDLKIEIDFQSLLATDNSNIIENLKAQNKRLVEQNAALSLSNKQLREKATRLHAKILKLRSRLTAK